MSKILSEKNILLFLSFFLITFVFINFTHNSSEKFKPFSEGKYYKLNNSEFKNNINEKLTSNENYDLVINKDCEITGNMHDRDKVRWVKSYFLKNFFVISNKFNSNFPYYANILLHSFLIFLTLIFLDQSFNLKKKHIIFYLLYISFIFQNYLGEYSYSIFEMFFASVALFASKRKNLILFLLITLLAVLNRESGFIILFTWLIYNKNFKEFLVFFLIIMTIFLLINFKTINCMLNPTFFIPLIPQEGQVNFNDFGSINIFSLTKLVFINYLIPFGIIFYNYYKLNIKNNYFILIVVIYLFTFLVATPAHHLAVRLIILPLIIFSFYSSERIKIN
jgi:hypothetical protein